MCCAEGAATKCARTLFLPFLLHALVRIWKSPDNVSAHISNRVFFCRLPLEPSSNRYMMHFKVIKTFVADNGLEMALLEVKGQSFMLHQIRKMIGLVIAIMRGYTDESVLELSWGTQRVDVPRAPGLGLMLDEVHYESYNRRFGSSDMHQALEWSR